MKRGELQRLLRVPCTVKQARQIKKRNVNCLAAIRTMVDDGVFWRRTIYSGCPHCIETPTKDCRKCGWYLYNPKARRENQFCQAGLFYGKTVGKVSGVTYLARMAVVGWNRKPTRAMIDNAIMFLKGHIEWADAVIKRRGVKGKRNERI